MSQSDFFIVSSKSVLFPYYPCHCHHFLLITQMQTWVSSWILASPSFSIVNRSPRMLFFLRCIFPIRPPLQFLRLAQLSSPPAPCGFLSDIFVPDDPSLLPGAPATLQTAADWLSFLKCCSLHALWLTVSRGPLLLTQPSPNLPACLSTAFITRRLGAPSVLFLTVSPKDPPFMTDLPTGRHPLHVPPASTLCASCACARNSLLCAFQAQPCPPTECSLFASHYRNNTCPLQKIWITRKNRKEKMIIT